ncbi:hypothetical protein [Algoriphagus sp.]|uniref:hypothetical protein n=1 Tax=Algoriphagus sp. TaxID=1872435 RepID=UPI00260099B2|nr:hypothetical protein [Algoriphagus sp.]
MKELKAENFLKYDYSTNGSIHEIDIQAFQAFKIESVLLEIKLNEIPKFWRGADYKWHPLLLTNQVANYHSPKLLKVSSGDYLLGMDSKGCWEWDAINKVLNWYLIHPDLNPTFQYNKDDKRDWIKEISVGSSWSMKLRLFSGKGPIPELARTPLGFIPTVSFTDHCDFDTPRLLKCQRVFFKKAGIKTTKGFFTHTFSHKGEYAALDQESMKSEFQSWEEDGHELAYHALSRSFREESWKEFQNLKSPPDLQPIKTYIDHGFLPYNYTKQGSDNYLKWYRHMNDCGVKLIWNYLDVMEGTALTNNQLNPFDSSIKSISESLEYHKKEGLPVDKDRNTKTWLSFGTSEDFDKAVKNLSGNVIRLKKSSDFFIPTLKALGKTTIAALNPEIWIKNLFKKEEPFHFARFTPVFFRAIDQIETDIQVFQTVSVKDFDSVFSNISLNKLLDECGLMIAHTYFAYLGGNHPGRLFEDETGKIRLGAETSLSNLGNLIQQEKVWNPTAFELMEYHSKLFEAKILYENGKLIYENAPGPLRWIN